jgi:hypothetical protein
MFQSEIASTKELVESKFKTAGITNHCTYKLSAQHKILVLKASQAHNTITGDPWKSLGAR